MTQQHATIFKKDWTILSMHEANEHYRRTMSFDHPLWMSVVPTSQIRLRLQIASYKSVE